MTIKELAYYIKQNKAGLNYPGVHPAGDKSIVLQYTRYEMGEFVHITDEHVFECCAKAGSFEEHIKLCKPLAKVDTQKFRKDRGSDNVLVLYQKHFAMKLNITLGYNSNACGVILAH